MLSITQSRTFSILHLLSKNVSQHVQDYILLPVTPYGWETWSLDIMRGSGQATEEGVF